MSKFRDYRDNMRDALARFVQHSSTIETIEAATVRRLAEGRTADPQPVGGKVTPLDYDLGQALHDNLAYRLASTRRDSARRAAVMWATAALVEVEAKRDEATVSGLRHAH